MDKKIGIFMVFVLLVGAVFLSACQEEVGGRLLSKAKDGGSNAQAQLPGSGGEGGITVAECNDNDDCEEGFVCIAGVCEIVYRAGSILWNCDDDAEADTSTSCSGEEDLANRLIEDGCTIIKVNCAET